MRTIELDLAAIHALIPREMDLEMLWVMCRKYGLKLVLTLRYGGRREAMESWSLSHMIGYVEMVGGGVDAQWVLQTVVSGMVRRTIKRLTPTFSFQPAHS